MSSSVFLSNVDDYVAPSQACVNPLFSEKTNAAATAIDKEEESPAPAAAAAVVGSVVPRRRRPRTNNPNRPLPTAAFEEPKEAVKASIADCLACSGCVTTAETVLLEETHSLQLIRDQWQQQDDKKPHRPRMVATISPAAFADFFRHVKVQIPNEKSYRQRQRQCVMLMAETLGVTHVLDGNLPLQWSLEESANEFCQAYQQQQQQKEEASASILSGSCPAVVCLVEKSSHGAVPHLSTTPSPQGMAGTFWKSLLGKDCFHVAIMPCHDKKLEASRPELLGGEKDRQVDLVLTTQDCVKLMLERLQVNEEDEENEKVQVLQRRLQEASQSHVLEMTDSTDKLQSVNASSPPTLLVSPLSQMLQPAREMTGTTAEQIFVYGSGGYADYIFRKACHTLFGVKDLPDVLPWKQIAATNGRRVSARVAAASTQRDFYQVSLYKQTDGSYSLRESSETPVLSFAIAYGMQTLQRVLTPYEKKNEPRPFHYVEAMACPSGCTNGGGQLRLAERERPSQTKERVQRTCETFQRPQSGASPPAWMDRPPQLEFRAVPPLQLAQGAVKGVAVKDVQW